MLKNLVAVLVIVVGLWLVREGIDMLSPGTRVVRQHRGSGLRLCGICQARVLLHPAQVQGSRNRLSTGPRGSRGRRERLHHRRGMPAAGRSNLSPGGGPAGITRCMHTPRAPNSIDRLPQNPCMKRAVLFLVSFCLSGKVGPLRPPQPHRFGLKSEAATTLAMRSLHSPVNTGRRFSRKDLMPSW